MITQLKSTSFDQKDIAALRRKHSGINFAVLVNKLFVVAR